MTAIITVPAFSDNYIWLICDKNKKYAVIVDPGDPRQLMSILEENEIEPIAVLITHFHFDHANGLATIIKRYSDLPVYGPQSEYNLLNKNPQPSSYGPASNCFQYLTHPLKGTEKLNFEKVGASFQVMNIPGHTSGHIAYYDSAIKKLFCGDTMFAAGCGRVFDGSYEELHDSLQKIKQLPDDTLIYCAHEYTLDNLGFAKWVEPDNADILAREEADRALIDADQATVPSLLSLELSTNPFMRTDKDNVRKRVEAATEKPLETSVEVFAAMRVWKDTDYD